METREREVLLKVRDLEVTFGNSWHRFKAVKGVSFDIYKGETFGIVGESGSGKSTMGRVLCGLLKPDSGEAVLDGVSVYASRAGRRNLQNKLSIVFQDYTTSANPRFRIRDIKKYTHSEIEEILFAADGRLTHKDGSPLAQAADTVSPEDI